MVFFFLVGSVSSYVIDSAVGAFIYHEGSFLHVLTSISSRTFPTRLYILISLAILSVLLYRFLVSRRWTEERLSALNFHGGKLNAARNFQEVYELTLDAMEKTLGFENAAFMVAEKGNLRIACYRGHTEPKLQELPIAGNKGITVRTAKTGRPILVPDVSKDKDYVLGFPSIRSELAAPILAQDRLLGVLNVESQKLKAFNEKDTTLLQILASHASTAISNLSKRTEIETRTSQMALLMKSSAKMIDSTDLYQRLRTIAEAIRDFGWRRVVISVRDENMEMKSPDDMVTVGVTDEEREFLWKKRPSGQTVRERYGPEYERFKIGEFYYLPWSDPWLRERYGYESSLLSHLKPKEMIDWHPQDTVSAPLRLTDGRIVGRLSMDDPADGRRPTKESLAPLELFLHQAAAAIENAQLIQQLNDAGAQLQQYAERLQAKVNEHGLTAQELAYERDLLQMLMDNIPDTIYFKDASSRFTRINRAQARALGVKDPADAVGKTDFDFFTEEHSRDAYTDEQRIMETGKPLISKIEKIVTPDGRLWWVSATKVPIIDKKGGIIGTVGISRDITEYKKMEEELRQYSEHLEELVKERTKELKEAHDQLLKSERLAAIGQLAGMVGHDLRNPLTGIAGATYYLKTKCGRKMNHKAKEMLEIIEKDIGYSNKIINDLMEYSKEIHLELTESNPKMITTEALSLVEIPQNVRVVDLTKKQPAIRVDVDKLKRAFINIIKNAVDAMPKGGKLTITSRESGDHCEIAFSDTGIGITRCVLDKLWSPLFTTKAKGMGFGLPVCKRVVEAHGGKISVESAIALGTTFTVSIPLNPPETEEKVWVTVPESQLSTATSVRTSSVDSKTCAEPS